MLGAKKVPLYPAYTTPSIRIGLSSGHYLNCPFTPSSPACQPGGDFFNF